MFKLSTEYFLIKWIFFIFYYFNTLSRKIDNDKLNIKINTSFRLGRWDLHNNSCKWNTHFQINLSRISSFTSNHVNSPIKTSHTKLSKFQSCKQKHPPTLILLLFQFLFVSWVSFSFSPNCCCYPLLPLVFWYVISRVFCPWDTSPLVTQLPGCFDMAFPIGWIVARPIWLNLPFVR